MARRILNRKELRADYEAASRKKKDEEEAELEEDEDLEDEDEEEEEGEGDEDEEEEEDELDEEAPRKKKKPVKAAKVAKPKTRSRSPKVVRLKVVWGVFNNSNQRVATFDYPKRKDAEELAAKLTADKKNTHFVQPVKEPLEEKKD